MEEVRTMNRTSTLLNRKLAVYLLPSIATAFAGQLGLILNGIFAGNMISTLALAAVAVCSPVLLLTMLLAWWIANGCVIQIGHYLGKNKAEEAGYVISASLEATVLIGIVIGAAVFIFARPISQVLTNAGDLQPMVELYLRVSMVGLPFESIYGIFVCCLGIDNYPNLGMNMVLMAQAVLIAGDFLFLSCTDWGVGGLALASQLGYFLSLIFVIPYIRGKYRTVKFSLRVPGWKKYIQETMKAGVTNAASNLVAIKDIAVNTVVVTVLGSAMMSVYSVCLYSITIDTALILGYTSTISLTGGILFGEKDYFGLRTIIRKLLIYAGLVTLALMIAVEVYPQFMVKLYGFHNPELMQITETALRIFAFGFIVVLAENFTQRYYPLISRGRIGLFFEVVYYIVFMIPFCIAGVFAGGIYGLCLGFVLSGPAAILTTDIYRRILTKKYGYENKGFLILRETSSKVIYDTTIQNKIAEASAVSEKIIECCREAGFDTHDSTVAGLAAEEIAASIALHGSRNTNRSEFIDIALSYIDGSLILRVRDDGVPYSPVDAIKEKNLVTEGIELVRIISSNYRYQRLLSLNNTVVEIKTTAAPDPVKLKKLADAVRLADSARRL